MEKHLLLLYCCKSYPTTKRNRQMQTQYINEWLDIPELKIHQLLSIHDDEVHIEALPLDDKQICPCCDSDQAVIRKGSNGMRTVRHLSVFEKKTYLHVPIIHKFCSNCEAGFVWAYDFVGPKQRYSRLFRSHTVEQALGYSKRRRVPYNVCITRRSLLFAMRFTNKCGKKQKKQLNWFWVSMTSRSRRVIRITPAFTTSKARPCWTCCRAESWKRCVRTLRRITPGSASVSRKRFASQTVSMFTVM